MALSDEEQQLLDQLEASLMEDDPVFVERLGSTKYEPRVLHRRNAALAGLLFVVGVLFLVLGVWKFWLLGVIGFVAMFAATIIALGSWRKASDAPQARAPQPSVNDRMEERWRRRQTGGM